MDSQRKQPLAEASVTVRIIRTCDEKGGVMRFKFADCTVDVTSGESEERVGAVAGCIGGGLEFRHKDIPGSWFLDPRDFWFAMCQVLGVKSYVEDCQRR